MSAPQRQREREADPALAAPPKPSPPLAIAAGTAPEPTGALALPNHRVAAIVKLTAEARAIHAERAEALNEISRLQGRVAEIARRLLAINAEVHKHAYDGEPLA